MKTRIEIGEDLEEISQKAAALFSETALRRAANREFFAAVLSGGKTPRKLYEMLAAPPYGNNLPWKSIHLFWGDERCVSPDDPQSNFGDANRLLISKIAIPPENVHRMKGELEPPMAGLEYEKEIREFFGSHNLSPEFDFNLLGLGADGHTASLFPKTAVLHESKKWVAGYFVEKAGMSRLTLTPPALNSSKLVVFLVSGANKAGTVKRVIEGPRIPDELPAQLIRPKAGILLWLLDRAAAAEIDVRQAEL